MRNTKLAVAAVAALFAGVSSAEAARLFFSNVGPGLTPSVGNPTITVTEGDTFQLHLWAELSPSGPTEIISGLGISVISTNTSVLEATANSIPQVSYFGGAFNRWEPVASNPNTGVLGDLYTNANAVAILALGLGGTSVFADPTFDASTNSYYVGTTTILATAAGTTDIFIRTGRGTISFKTGNGGPFIFFGTGDDQVDPRTEGVQSQLPDATIIVEPIPEPASLSLLALGALPMLRRRRA